MVKLEKKKKKNETKSFNQTRNNQVNKMFQVK